MTAGLEIHGAVKTLFRFNAAYFFIKFDRHYELRGPYWSSSTITLSHRLGNGFIDDSHPYQRLSHHNHHLIFIIGSVFHEINDERANDLKIYIGDANIHSTDVLERNTNSFIRRE